MERVLSIFRRYHHNESNVCANLGCKNRRPNCDGNGRKQASPPPTMRRRRVTSASHSQIRCYCQTVSASLRLFAHFVFAFLKSISENIADFATDCTHFHLMREQQMAQNPGGPKFWKAVPPFSSTNTHRTYVKIVGEEKKRRLMGQLARRRPHSFKTSRQRLHAPSVFFVRIRASETCVQVTTAAVSGRRLLPAHLI